MPTVTPQAVDDAIDTIRKRTNSLGVSESEIQRSGRDQISVGLPDVQNAQRAIEQVGTTAQLQFYDWEPNVLGRGPDSPYAGTKALFQATEAASKEKPKAEATDVPPGSDMTPAEADAANDSTSGPTLLPLRAGRDPDRPRRQAAPHRGLRPGQQLRRGALRLRLGAGRARPSTPRAPPARRS